MKYNVNNIKKSRNHHKKAKKPKSKKGRKKKRKNKSKSKNKTNNNPSNLIKSSPPKQRQNLNPDIYKSKTEEVAINSKTNMHKSYKDKLKFINHDTDNNNNKNSKNKIEYNNVNELMDLNDQELNTLNYKEALIIDKRTYLQYYAALIKRKQKIIFTFYTKDDYNSRTIKICLFFFSFALFYTVNDLFFSDSTMHKIYEDNGKFNFIYQIPQILYSTIISSIINVLVNMLSLSERNIILLKKDSKNILEKKPKIINCLKLKFILFYILVFILLLFFWYYLSCFCAVYKNTQFYLIKDSLISFLLSLLYPFGLCLLPGLFRIPSLKSPNQNKELLYKISKIVQLI